jgi:hypothetical protein
MANELGILGGGFAAIWGLGIIWGMIFFLFTLYTLIDATKSKFVEGTDKIMWALLIVLTPFLGPILYLVIGRKQKAPGEAMFLADVFEGKPTAASNQ